MNAVLEKPVRKAPAPKANPAPTVPELKVSKDAALFMEVGNFLKEACGTDEDHAFSGESDRLLSIGAMIAFDAAQGKLSNNTLENTAYDVAVCINSARLVPDDSESAERTVHIGNAAERLATIAGMQAHRMVFTDVPRPTRAPKPAAEPTSAPAPASGGKQFTTEQLKELHWRAYVFMECASSVLFHYAEHADDSAVFAMRDLLEVYLKEAKSRCTVRDDQAGSEHYRVNGEGH